MYGVGGGGMRVWVFLDVVVKVLGVDDVVEVLGCEFIVMWNGMCGMIWLELLVEVEWGGVCYGYGLVEVGDVVGLLDVLCSGVDYLLVLGLVEDLFWMWV